MLSVLKQCFPNEMESIEWKTVLKEMIPSYGLSLIDNPRFCKSIREITTKELKLERE